MASSFPACGLAGGRPFRPVIGSTSKTWFRCLADGTAPVEANDPFIEMQRKGVVMSPYEMQIQLKHLQAERALASLEGLTTDSIYMADLEDEIANARNAYVVAAVTEIASLRSQLSGLQVG
jgi:hypothetical protein